MLHACTRVAPGVYRLGDRMVNFYLVETDGGLVMVDAGLPGHSAQLLDAVAWVGGRLRAVVLTHAHPDHIGLAERARRDGGARVWVHEADSPILRDGPNGAIVHSPPERSFAWTVLRRPRVLSMLAHVGYYGGFSSVRVGEHATFGDGQVLEQVPGRPRVLSVPGHTRGSSVVYFEERKVAFTGDALVTHDAVTGHRGPCLVDGMSTHDTAWALRSLGRLSELAEETVLLPGHGEPFTQGVSAAVSSVRGRGAR